MLKKFVYIVLTMLMVAGLVACTDSATTETVSTETSTEVSTVEASDELTETSSAPIYIGVVTYLTGTNQSWGEEAVKGADLALSEINANGGILGQQVEVKYFDAIDTQQTVVNAVKLALEDESLSCLIMVINSSNTVACLPYIEEAQMPTFVSGSAVSIMEAENPYVWQPRTIDKYSAIAIVNYAIEDLGYSNPAIWTITAENSIACKDVYVERLSELGINISEDMVFSNAEEETNYAPIAAQIKASGADCLLINSSSLPIAYLAKALQDADVDIPVVGNTGIANSVCLEVAGDAVEGWYVACEYLTQSNEVAQAYAEAYIAAYGTEKTPDSASQSYDMCYMFKAACENAQSTTDWELINEGISNIKDIPTTWGIATFQEDHTPFSELFMAQMEGDTAVYIETIKYR